MRPTRRKLKTLGLELVTYQLEYQDPTTGVWQEDVTCDTQKYAADEVRGFAKSFPTYKHRLIAKFRKVVKVYPAPEKDTPE